MSSVANGSFASQNQCQVAWPFACDYFPAMSTAGQDTLIITFMTICCVSWCLGCGPWFLEWCMSPDLLPRGVRRNTFARCAATRRVATRRLATRRVLPCSRQVRSVMSMQQAAAAAAADNLLAPDSASMRLARLGSWGQAPQNVERDLQRLLRKTRPVDLQPYLVPLPYRLKQHGVRYLPHALLPPPRSLCLPCAAQPR